MLEVDITYNEKYKTIVDKLEEEKAIAMECARNASIGKFDGDLSKIVNAFAENKTIVAIEITATFGKMINVESIESKGVTYFPIYNITDDGKYKIYFHEDHKIPDDLKKEVKQVEKLA